MGSLSRLLKLYIRWSALFTNAKITDESFNPFTPCLVCADEGGGWWWWSFLTYVVLYSG